MAAENIRLEVAAPIRRARKPAVGGPPWLAALVEFGRRRTLGAAGGLVIVLMLAMALFANIIAPYDPLDTSFLAQLKPPSSEHLIGTDAFGRDVFSRLIYGSRTALTIERLMDVLISFPLLILAIAVVTVLGPGPFNSGVIIAITVPIIPRVARVIRASALSIRRMPFVEAAHCIGAGDRRIVLHHMLPNVMAPYLILLTAFLGQAILSEAALSFLGLGVSEPTPAWGLMLRGASVQFLEKAPWLAIAPGVALSLAVFAFNLLGDSLRDALDPRLRL